MMSLLFLDYFYTALHLLIIGFNLLAWIFPVTRRLHLYGVALTLGSWLILGIWYGIGYCPVTDWQWEVKTRLGESQLPASFVKYYADKITGMDINNVLIDIITLVSFAVAICCSIRFNFFKRKIPLQNVN